VVLVVDGVDDGGGSTTGMDLLAARHGDFVEVSTMRFFGSGRFDER